MANLLISRVCNCECPYCFAVDYLHTPSLSQPARFIGLNEFAARLDWLESSSIRQVRLLGGEPTLHPQFRELIEQVSRRHKHVLLFTHGWIPELALRVLEDFPAKKCRVIINMNARLPGRDPKVMEARRRDVFKRLGVRAQPGFNISERKFQLEPLFTLIQELGSRKAIRLGLAQPTLTGKNKHLHPKHYRQVGAQIANFAEEAARAGIVLEFDCGFVRCMFSQAELNVMQAANVDIDWRCNPILDIDLDGSVFHCFPLAERFHTCLSSDRDAASLRSELFEATNPYRQAGIFRECSSCLQKQKGICTGGCLASTIRRFSSNPITIAL
jgi:sulfatase maturation enzyme AslB (radical SAM superfamily)